MVSGSLTGGLDIRMIQSGLSVQGVVVDGDLVVDFGGGAYATLTVKPDPGNTVETDLAGEGWITTRFAAEHSVESWAALLPGEMRLRVPVTTTSSGVIHADTSSAQWDEYFVPRMRSYTDFNLDGVLDFASDFTEFIEAHSTSDPGTDINADGAWTQADIDLWMLHFDEDLVNHGN